MKDYSGFNRDQLEAAYRARTGKDVDSGKSDDWLKAFLSENKVSSMNRGKWAVGVSLALNVAVIILLLVPMGIAPQAIRVAAIIALAVDLVLELVSWNKHKKIDRKEGPALGISLALTVLALVLMVFHLGLSPNVIRLVVIVVLAVDSVVEAYAWRRNITEVM